MRIIVKQEHIEKGQCKNPHTCAIAAAIRDADPRVVYVRVRTNGITITRRFPDGGSQREHYMVPTHAARAIIRFDQGEKVEPFSFTPMLAAATPIPPVSQKRRHTDHARTTRRRAKLKAAGIPPVKYGRATRVSGV